MRTGRSSGGGLILYGLRGSPAMAMRMWSCAPQPFLRVSSSRSSRAPRARQGGRARTHLDLGRRQVAQEAARRGRPHDLAVLLALALHARVPALDGRLGRGRLLLVLHLDVGVLRLGLGRGRTRAARHAALVAGEVRRRRAVRRLLVQELLLRGGGAARVRVRLCAEGDGRAEGVRVRREAGGRRRVAARGGRRRDVAVVCGRGRRVSSRTRAEDARERGGEEGGRTPCRVVALAGDLGLLLHAGERARHRRLWGPERALAGRAEPHALEGAAEAAHPSTGRTRAVGVVVVEVEVRARGRLVVGFGRGLALQGTKGRVSSVSGCEGSTGCALRPGEVAKAGER